MGQNVTAKMAFQKILYCRWFFVALLVCVTLPAVTLAAQEERPQITPGERKATKKKDAGPRAVSVLQLAANGKASLVPVAILVGGRFWDATAYKADPVPMSLEPGTVYEAERAGSSLGLFTVNSALHRNAANGQTPWLGTGAWVPAGTEKPKTALQAEKEPLGIESNDAPPRLTRHSSSPNQAPPASPAPASSPDTSSGSPGPSQTPTGTSKPGDSKPSDTKPSDAKPNDAKPNDIKPPGRPAPPQSDSGAAEDNRPRLRRGKPAEPLPEDDVPGYSKPGAVASAAAPANAGTPSQPTADKAVQLIPAISDAGGPEPKSFAFEWLKDEEGERLKQMTALASEQVRAYVATRAKARIVPAPLSKSPRSQTARRSAGSKAPVVKTADPILENVQMKTYDLWGNNQPVMVFTADAHMPPPPAATPHSEADSDLQYSIVLAANPDIYGNLHKLYVGVTDKYHLDMTPRFELVDAVDADGDGRGELLFRETSDNGNGWAIYRVTADKLWKLFDSLNPQ